MEIWKYGNIKNGKIEIWKYEFTEIWKYVKMEKWKNGNM